MTFVNEKKIALRVYFEEMLCFEVTVLQLNIFLPNNNDMSFSVQQMIGNFSSEAKNRSV